MAEKYSKLKSGGKIFSTYVLCDISHVSDLQFCLFQIHIIARTTGMTLYSDWNIFYRILLDINHIEKIFYINAAELTGYDTYKSIIP
jgi:hypothetical protein